MRSDSKDKPKSAIVAAVQLPHVSDIEFESSLAELRDPSERATLLSSFGMFFEIGAGIGGLLIGPVARGSGLPTAFRVSAIAPILALGLVGWMARQAAVAGRLSVRSGKT